MSNPPPDVPQTSPPPRSRILLSIPMAWTLILLGYLCNFGECLYAGFTLMISVCSYSWLSDLQFFAYYCQHAISYSYAHIFLLWFFSVIHCTYATFSFKTTKIRLASILYIISAVFGIIAAIISFLTLKTDMAYVTMYRRDGAWWVEELTGDAYSSWRKDTFLPFRALDIARTVLILLMAVIFVFSFNISSPDFNRSFGLA